MHIISRFPSLTITPQEINWDELQRILTLEVRAKYTEISIGATFDYCFDNIEGAIISHFNCSVVGIQQNEEVLKILRPGKVGLVSLEFEAFPALLINFIKVGKVNIGSFRDRLFNVYLTDTLSLEPVNDNKQVLRLLESSKFDEHRNLVCYVARALEEDVSTGQHFDVLWNVTDVGEVEECSIVLEKVYNNRLQEQGNVYSRIPSIVFLNIKQKLNGLYSDGMVSFGKSMAIGKRKLLSNSHPA